MGWRGEGGAYDFNVQGLSEDRLDRVTVFWNWHESVGSWTLPVDFDAVWRVLAKILSVEVDLLACSEVIIDFKARRWSCDPREGCGAKRQFNPLFDFNPQCVGLSSLSSEFAREGTNDIVVEW